MRIMRLLMKTDLKRSPIAYIAAVLLTVLAIGIIYSLQDSIGDIMVKKRLSSGVQIMATVTDREDRFSVMRGGAFRTYQIDYKFQYTDRQTGQLKEQVRAGYEVYEKEYATFTPGSTFVATFIPAEPNLNEPSATVGRLSPQSLWAAGALTGLVSGALTLCLFIFKLSRLLNWVHGFRRWVVLAALFCTALLVGSMIGVSVARLFESILL